MLFFCQTFSQKLPVFSKYFHSNSNNAVFFHTITTGHYWRNSYIKELQLLYQINTNEYEIKIWKTEREEEEYNLLELLAEQLKNVDLLIGYNSNSFHLPYLKQKYKAYGLYDPFSKITHVDILKKYKDMGNVLNLSLKLSDLKLYFHLNDDESEIRCIFETANLLLYNFVFKGDFTVKEINRENEEIYVTLQSSIEELKAIRFNQPAFYFISENNTIKLKIRLFEGKLRVYHSDYQNYYYLPAEDMAIHKSLASSISKEYKEKATSDNCYTYTKCPDAISFEYMKKYVMTLFRHLYI